MKKSVMIVLMVSLMVLISCGKNQESVDDFIIQESIILAKEIKVFSEDDTYLKNMVGSLELSQITDNIKTQDFTIPNRVSVFQVTKDDILDAYSKLSGISVNADSLKEKVLKKINGYLLVTQLNINEGIEMQVFTSITAWGKSYLQPENWKESVVVFLEYEGDYALIVSYDVTGDGVISSIASYVNNSDGELGNQLDSFFESDTTEKIEYSKDQINEILGELK